MADGEWLMNGYLVVILVFLVGRYVVNMIADLLNVRNLALELPGEFEEHYDLEKYRKSQEYLRDTTKVDLVADTVMLSALVVFILANGFNYVDGLARASGFNEVVVGLVFAGIIVALSQLVRVPFSIYDTFVIEEKYGFNRTTWKTFVSDLLKMWVLGILLGAPVFAAITWFFIKTGSMAWIYCWIVVTLFQLFVAFIAPVLILPLFNKFVPLEEGELRSAIEDYASEQGFKLEGIYKMDGSKRSTKSNAFFTGFGRFRRIALYDTLIENHAVDELVSVLAHEIGHCKKKHVIKFIAISVATTGLMFYLLSLFIENLGLFAGFGMEKTSVYASLVFFGFLYTPISMVLSVAINAISRRHEFEADKFAADTYGKTDSMIAALKKLSADNLSNLTPHPLKVLLSYSHPPVLERTRALGEE